MSFPPLSSREENKSRHNKNKRTVIEQRGLRAADLLADKDLFLLLVVVVGDGEQKGLEGTFVVVGARPAIGEVPAEDGTAVLVSVREKEEGVSVRKRGKESNEKEEKTRKKTHSVVSATTKLGPLKSHFS